MNKHLEAHPFWGSQGPLFSLSSGALLVLASPRLAFALITVLALIFIYVLSAVVSLCAKKIIPRAGRYLILIFIAGFFSSVFALILSLASPLLVLELNIIILLVPVSFINTSVSKNLDTLAPDDGLYEAVLEAMILGGLITALALIREPFSYGALSIPGRQGIIEWAFADSENPYFSHLISTIAGGFIVLGYAVALARKIRKKNSGAEE
ncbi:MAG: hypothetical protein LBH73_03955 [Spirochaetaceae bacterium]|jgi:Na+-translocating ferredoxin:NAD+ oxidoreductase RnfE subunit|nr:hypothetical protein [Spirochaetaceae bacterium]